MGDKLNYETLDAKNAAVLAELVVAPETPEHTRIIQLPKVKISSE